tara:strand:- start:10068 stop:11087 length:1020 start_codon:yes stop_codon:yes gene_type:complete
MISSENIINSFNFARRSDYVFSEIVTHEQFKKLNLGDYIVLDKNDRSIFYKMTRLDIKDNDIIFSNTDTIGNLFNLLKNNKKVKNLKLITNQTDKMINKYLYRMKPSSVSEWYSINVDYESSDLIPIPYGVANKYSPKNLFTDDFSFEKKIDYVDSKMYINFQKNTNLSERQFLYDHFDQFDWAKIKQPTLKLEDYKKDLAKYRFVLCPWGNGVDTHRVWETLYSGSIPITKYHHTYSTSTELPILFVNDYLDITNDLLNNFYKNIYDKDLNFNKLNIKTWFLQINSNQVESSNSEIILEKKVGSNLFRYNLKTRSKIMSYIKKIKYIFKQVLKLKKFL